MEDTLIILDGTTFVCTEANGDVEAQKADGYFYRDVRHLSRWQLRIDGAPVKPLSAGKVDYYSARTVGIPETNDSDGPMLSIRRDRFVSEGLHEDVFVENLREEPHDVRVEVLYASDFADMMEARESGGGEGRIWQEPRARSVTLWNDREGYRRGTVVSFSRRGRVLKERAVFDVRLGSRETWKLEIDITPIVDDVRKPPLLGSGAFHDHAPKMPMSLEEWLTRAPTIETDQRDLERSYLQSLVDLAALRIRPDELTIKYAMPGGGMPWYMAVFGRDSLIAAYQALPFHADLAQSTLEALAELQATEWDNWRDAEPGKILHELRRGTLAALGAIPHTPYYGTHDATILWLIVLDEYHRWTGDTRFVKRLEEPARAALGWVEGPADVDGDGYLEYRKRSSSKNALDNQCWKDSDNSILFDDGRKAEPPIATCEIQGYAYDARLRTARLLREVWGDPETAARLEREAAALKRRFNRDFWIAGRRHYALALDGEKQQVDSMTSNPGHLLWSGIVDERRAAGVVRRLLREDMFSGWGIRSMSTEAAGFNPLEYHNGTVWPHDTMFAAEGMRRYGFRDQATQLACALLDAASAFDGQLPELWAGFARDDASMPVEYPEALKPQSWAAGSVLLALRTLLGLDAVDGRLRSRPHLPRGVRRLRLRGIRVHGKKVDAP